MDSVNLIESYFRLSEQERLARFLGSDITGLPNCKQFAVGGAHYVVLHEDGRVTAYGDNSCGQCNVDGWENVVKVAAGDKHTVALKKDRSVAAVGDNEYGQCNVESWPRGMVDIFAERDITVGIFSVGSGTDFVYATSAYLAPGARVVSNQRKNTAGEQKNPAPQPAQLSKWEAIEKINGFAEFYIKYALKQMGKNSMFYVHRLEMLDDDFLNELYRNLAENYSPLED